MDGFGGMMNLSRKGVGPQILRILRLEHLKLMMKGIQSLNLMDFYLESLQIFTFICITKNFYPRNGLFRES